MVAEDLLGRVLRGREAWFQAKAPLMAKAPEATWVELSLNIPGWPKCSQWTKPVFDAAIDAIFTATGSAATLAIENDAGHFCLFNVPLSAPGAKAAAVGLEASHPWGRLWDIDVYAGSQKLPREITGASERRCLACYRPHSECIASRRHPREALRLAAKLIATTPPSSPQTAPDLGDRP